MADLSDDAGEKLLRQLGQGARTLAMALARQLAVPEQQRLADFLRMLNAASPDDRWCMATVDSLTWLGLQREKGGTVSLEGVRHVSARDLRKRLEQAGVEARSHGCGVFWRESQREAAERIIDQYERENDIPVVRAGSRDARQALDGLAGRSRREPRETCLFSVGDREVAGRVADELARQGYVVTERDGDVLMMLGAEERLRGQAELANLAAAELAARSSRTFTERMGDPELARRVVDSLGTTKGAEVRATEAGDVEYRLEADATGIDGSFSRMSLERALADARTRESEAIAREREGHGSAREEGPVREAVASPEALEVAADKTRELDPSMRQLLGSRPRAAQAPEAADEAAQAHVRAVDADLRHPADVAIGDTPEQAEAAAPLDPSRDGRRQEVAGQQDVDGDGLPVSADDRDGDGIEDGELDLEPDGSPDRGKDVGKYMEEVERRGREVDAFEREMGQRGQVEMPREAFGARL